MFDGVSMTTGAVHDPQQALWADSLLPLEAHMVLWKARLQLAS